MRPVTKIMITVLLAGATARAGLLIDHDPVNTGGPLSDTLAVNDLGQTEWQRVADDFIVGAPAEVRRLVWWGFYHLDNPPTQETMRVRLYDARPSDGLPGNVLFEESIDNPQREWTGRIVFVGGAPREFRFQADLSTPMSLIANTPYWLEVVQIGDITTRYRWEHGHGGSNGHAFINAATVDWRHTTVLTIDMAFQLWAIPEPGSLCLLALGALLLARRR